MTDLREAAQMALDALEQIHRDNMTTIAEENWSKAIEALRAALARPELEPGAWMCKTGHGTFLRETINEEMANFTHGGKKAWEPLYTATPQREWKGLTDDDFIGLTTPQIFAMKFAEAKLKEKNA